MEEGEARGRGKREEQDLDMWNILGKGPGVGPELDEGAVVRVGFPSCEQRGPWEHWEPSLAPADVVPSFSSIWPGCLLCPLHPWLWLFLG